MDQQPEKQPRKNPDPRHRASPDAGAAPGGSSPSTPRRRRIVSGDPRREARRQRLQAIRAIDVSTGKFVAAKQCFDGLIDRADAGIEGQALVMFGRSGAGKSHMISQLMKHPDLQPGENEEGDYQPLLKIVAPSPCTLRTLGLRILRRLMNQPPAKSLREHEVWERVVANLQAQRVAVLVIDEMHNVLVKRNVEELSKIAMTLKSLMVADEDPIQLVIAGLPKTKDFFDSYSELHRRSHFIELRKLRDVKDSVKLVKFLEGLERGLGQADGAFSKGDMPERFQAAADGLVGRMAYFAQEAATMAVSLNQGSISRQLLAEAYRRPYGVAPSANPFLIGDPGRLPKSRDEELMDKAFEEMTLLKGKREVDPSDGE